MENIIIISLIIYFIYHVFLKKFNEKFTLDEMKDYSNMLKINCDKNKKLYNELSIRNQKNCNKKGQTERETINNKSICYDDIGKEIISKFDMESNCIISDIVNKTTMNTNKILADQSSTNIINKQFTTATEGPEFINQWNTSTFEPQKINKFSDITLMNNNLLL